MQEQPACERILSHGCVSDVLAVIGQMRHSLINRDQNEDYVLRVGEGNELELFIQLSNNAEDAHEATLALEMPPHVFYKGINTNVSSHPKPNCKCLM